MVSVKNIILLVEETVEVLLNAGYHVTVRPHLMTYKLAPKCIQNLVDKFDRYTSFDLDPDTSSSDLLHIADIMVSDWSGVALEFAFGLEKPIAFIDVPIKVNNPEYSRLRAIPIEISLRDKIGKVLPADNLAQLPALIAELRAAAVSEKLEFQKLREQYVFNIGKSADRGAEAIMTIFKESVSGTKP